MIRLAASAVISVIAGAVGLILAGAVLDDMAVGVSGLILAVLVFAGTSVVADALIRQNAARRMPALVGSSALVSTLIALIVTVIVTDSIAISGLSTWIIATVIVWGITLAARLLLPLLLFKKILNERRD